MAVITLLDVDIGTSGWNGIIKTNFERISDSFNAGGFPRKIIKAGESVSVYDYGQYQLINADLTLEAGAELKLFPGAEYISVSV